MDTYKKLIQIIIENQKEDILKELYFNKKNTTQKIDSIFYFINQIFLKLDKDLIIVFYWYLIIMKIY
jgi:hypothetical protein